MRIKNFIAKIFNNENSNDEENTVWQTYLTYDSNTNRSEYCNTLIDEEYKGYARIKVEIVCDSYHIYCEIPNVNFVHIARCDEKNYMKKYEAIKKDIQNFIDGITPKDLDYDFYAYFVNKYEKYKWETCVNSLEVGSEGGVVLADEEYRGLSHITLERCNDYYAITCGMYYRLFVHTMFCDETNYNSIYENMKEDLANFIDGIVCYEDESDFFCEFVRKYGDWVFSKRKEDESTGIHQQSEQLHSTDDSSKNKKIVYLTLREEIANLRKQIKQLEKHIENMDDKRRLTYDNSMQCYSAHIVYIVNAAKEEVYDRLFWSSMKVMCFLIFNIFLAVGIAVFILKY